MRTRQPGNGIARNAGADLIGGPQHSLRIRIIQESGLVPPHRSNRSAHALDAQRIVVHEPDARHGRGDALLRGFQRPFARFS